MARGREPRPLGSQAGCSRGNRLGLSQRALFCPMATREYRPRPGNDAQWQRRLARSRRCWAEADRQIEYNVFAASLRRHAKVGPKTGVRCGKRHTEASSGQEDKRSAVHTTQSCVSTRVGGVLSTTRHRLDRAGDCHVSAGGRNRIDRARILVSAWAWCGPLRSDIGCGKAVDAKMNFFCCRLFPPCAGTRFFFCCAALLTTDD